MVKCVSIFSGAGGLDVGAKQAGAEIVACVEFDQDSIETLKKNDPSGTTEYICDDIRNVDFLRFQSENSESCILIGGPPCQPFSKNGYWVRNDNRLIEADPRNMIGQYLRALSEMKPTGFIFENVDSIFHPTNRQALEGFVQAASDLGYACTVTRANALDFGVPQRRKRVFVFGILNGKAPIPQPLPTHMSGEDPADKRNLPKHPGVGPFITKYSGAEYAEPQEDASSGTYYHELCNVLPGRNYICLNELPDYEGKTFRPGGRFWNFLFKLHPDQPSITIAAQPGPWVGPFHWDNRRLRVKEIAAIQTFPEDYKFHGNRRSVQKQIGNAVPCLLARRMTEHLIAHLQ